MLVLLQYVSVLIGLGLGVAGFARPSFPVKVVGIALNPDLPHSVSEIRATYGGLFIGMSGYALVSGADDAFLTIGVAWTGAGLARLASIALDRAANRPNFMGLMMEISMGVFAGLPSVLARIGP